VTGPELVFVGQIAPEATAPEEPVARQAQAVFAGLEAALAERKLRLDDLLRLRLFVTDLRDLPEIERAMDSFAPLQWPAVSVLELSGGSDEEPGARRGARAAVTLDAVAAPGARTHRQLAPHSARLGPWVFLGAIAGAPRRRGLSRRGRIRAESRALFASIGEHLRAQDAALGDVVKVGGWLTFGMGDYEPLGQVRDALVSRAGLLPASAATQVGRVQPSGALLSFEAIAFAPRDDAERERVRAAQLPAPSRLAPFYADARSAGGYVFTCGEVPSGPAAVDVQAREVYERLRSHLAAHGASPADTVQQTVFVRGGLREGHAAVARAASEFFGAEVPPTTLLTVADLGFHRGCDVEIELVASPDGRSADGR
jgi:enamine deaminase RidA (YjgF/YER057c/UK114 family)